MIDSVQNSLYSEEESTNESEEICGFEKNIESTAKVIDGIKNLTVKNISECKSESKCESKNESKCESKYESKSNELSEMKTESEEKEETFMRITTIKGKYSTTSTVYAEHTISNPNHDQGLFCIAAILQAQIFEDEVSSAEAKCRYPEYDVTILLPPDLGGDINHILESVLDNETLHDRDLREKVLQGTVPTVDTIFRFINLLFQRAKFSTECNIIALIYVNRLTSSGNLPLTMSNWRGIWLSTINLAQKMWDDIALRTTDFINILPSVSKEQLRAMERKTLSLIEFETAVKPSLYAKYYFKLRDLFTEITGGETEKYAWPLRPLTIIEQKRLEDRSLRTAVPFSEIPNAKGGKRGPIVYTPNRPKSDANTPALLSMLGSPNLPEYRQSPSGKPYNYTYEDVTRTDTSRYVIS